MAGLEAFEKFEVIVLHSETNFGEGISDGVGYESTLARRTIPRSNGKTPALCGVELYREATKFANDDWIYHTHHLLRKRFNGTTSRHM